MRMTPEQHNKLYDKALENHPSKQEGTHHSEMWPGFNAFQDVESYLNHPISVTDYKYSPERVKDRLRYMRGKHQALVNIESGANPHWKEAFPEEADRIHIVRSFA